METYIEELHKEIKNKIIDGGFELAINLTTNLLRLNNKDEYGYYYRGVCNFALERYHLAIQNYSVALQINQGFAKAYFNVGVCYYMLKYYDYALINIAKALFIFSKIKDENSKNRCINALELIESERACF